jgi:hypothetical protein
MPTFEDYALEKMQQLMAHKQNQIGSLLFKRVQQICTAAPANPDCKTAWPVVKKMDVTDCITFAMHVLAYAFEQTGQKSRAEQVRRHSKRGTSLASYLVQSCNWKAYYWNPDVHHPFDGNSEHPFSYQQAVKSHNYYGIPLSGFIINYRPSPVAKGKPTAANYVALTRLKQVKFAYVLARGGFHTFLYSLGDLYEAHWDKVADALYEATPFDRIPWLSGVLAIPPSIGFRPDANAG